MIITKPVIKKLIGDLEIFLSEVTYMESKI